MRSIACGSTQYFEILKCNILTLNFFQSVSFNKDMTEFSITGQNAADVEQLVHKLAYINYRPFPTPGRRNLNLRTSVQ